MEKKIKIEARALMLREKGSARSESTLEMLIQVQVQLPSGQPME